MKTKKNGKAVCIVEFPRICISKLMVQIRRTGQRYAIVNCVCWSFQLYRRECKASLPLAIAKIRTKFSINEDGYRCLTKSRIDSTRVLKTSLVSYVDKDID